MTGGEDHSKRHIPLKGPANFRDIGGYKTKEGRTVKWRRVFRSDAHNSMTPEDVAYALDTLRIVTVLDLRGHDESGSGQSRLHASLADAALDGIWEGTTRSH